MTDNDYKQKMNGLSTQLDKDNTTIVSLLNMKCNSLKKKYPLHKLSKIQSK